MMMIFHEIFENQIGIYISKDLKWNLKNDWSQVMHSVLSKHIKHDV